MTGLESPSLLRATPRRPKEVQEVNNWTSRSVPDLFPLLSSVENVTPFSRGFSHLRNWIVREVPLLGCPIECSLNYTHGIILGG